jgi:hypothetical protein
MDINNTWTTTTTTTTTTASSAKTLQQLFFSLRFSADSHLADCVPFLLNLYLRSTPILSGCFLPFSEFISCNYILQI